jgi:uncharacterized protein YehS (DUF1456 family)
MTNNDILRRLRYALKLADPKMVEIFGMAGVTITGEEARAIMGHEGEEGAIFCVDDRLRAFLDGLIIDQRGPRDPSRPAVPDVGGDLTNNDILKKLRIALNLRETDLQAILQLGGQELSKGELGALFRKPDHKHFRECGNQVMRKFLAGLTRRLRPDDVSPEDDGPESE